MYLICGGGGDEIFIFLAVFWEQNWKFVSNLIFCLTLDELKIYLVFRYFTIYCAPFKPKAFVSITFYGKWPNLVLTTSSTEVLYKYLGFDRSGNHTELFHK